MSTGGIDTTGPFLETLNLKPGQKVLDVGCGSGGFIKRDPKNYHGIDISKSLVDICVEKGLTAVVGSAIDLPFEDESIEAKNGSPFMKKNTNNEVLNILASYAGCDIIQNKRFLIISRGSQNAFV